MVHWSRRACWFFAMFAIALSCAACSIGGPAVGPQTLTITAIFPATGTDAAIGQTMRRAVDLAVSQNATLDSGHKLAVIHLDEAGGYLDHSISDAGSTMVGVVGPFDNPAAVALLPAIANASVAAISPTATLPGLTLPDQAQAEGLSFEQLHPKGKPIAFFRLASTDTVAGKAAANLALASTQAHGLAAQSVFIVDDGSPSGKALTAAVTQQLAVRHATLAGSQSIALSAPDSVQSAITAIIQANPDAVFYGGSTAGAAALRSALTLTGAPQLPILTTGAPAANPGWSAAVGMPAVAGYTSAILSAKDLSTLPNAKTFINAYQAAYPGVAPTPQSALAYDAAMDEITAIKTILNAGKPVTRSAVLSAIATGSYAGITGPIAFDAHGDATTPTGLSLYACDTKGVWNYQTTLAS